MGRSKSSQRWLREHHSDVYVKKSREDGFRSRASYKLLELDRLDKLLRPAMTVIDLGAAPGGWSQIVAEKVGHKGAVIACDILPMDSIAGVDFIQGDFTEEGVLENILELVGDRPIDLVISDMAPNMSGLKAVDIPKAMYLVELALDLSRRVLKKNGVFVAKVFHGAGFDELLKECRQQFNAVVIRKPDASRSRSRETYLVAKGFKGE